MAEEEEKPAVVMDVGSANLRAGFSGDLKVYEPSVVGRPIYRGVCNFGDMVMKGKGVEAYYGADAELKRGILFCAHPVVGGLVQEAVDLSSAHRPGLRHPTIPGSELTGWELLEMLCAHTLGESRLRVAPGERPTMLVEPPFTPKAAREKKAEIFFETLKACIRLAVISPGAPPPLPLSQLRIALVPCPYQVPAFQLKDSAALTCYSIGRVTGCVLSVGAGVSQVNGVYEGYVVPHVMKRTDLAGYSLTERMAKLLGEAGYFFTTTMERAAVQDIKEKLSFVAEDYADELRKVDSNADLQQEYELPDGQVLKVGAARFQCPELLFQPALGGKETDGVHTMLYKSIRQAGDFHFQQDLFANITCEGGSTMFRGFAGRLTSEISKLAPAATKIDVVAPAGKDRLHAPWIGGSILTGLSTMHQMWIEKAEYDDAGPQIVHRKLA